MSGSEAMDLDKAEMSPEGKAMASACSICLELVLDRGDRSVAKLHCGHEFHLDCIGSAFNAKGAMQCPNCRKVEKGRWLYANGHRSSADLDFDGWMSEEIYDLSYSELPFGFQWCPFRGFTQLASFFENISSYPEGESRPNSYHELMGNSTFGEHSNPSSSSHVCPYLALHGFSNSMHGTSSSADSVPESASFHRHPVQSNPDMISPHIFPPTEPQNHNWHQQHSPAFPLSGNPDQPPSQYGGRLPRNESSSHQRMGSFIHPHHLIHGPVARNGSNVIASLGPAAVIGEKDEGARRLNSHLFYCWHCLFLCCRDWRVLWLLRLGICQQEPSSGWREAPHGPVLWVGGREGGVTPLPWIPVEGESQWWGPFNPNSNSNPNPSQPGGSFAQRASNAERVQQSHPENIYPRMPPPPPPPRMPPFMRVRRRRLSSNTLLRKKSALGRREERRGPKRQKRRGHFCLLALIFRLQSPPPGNSRTIRSILSSSTSLWPLSPWLSAPSLPLLLILRELRTASVASLSPLPPPPPPLPLPLLLLLLPRFRSSIAPAEAADSLSSTMLGGDSEPGEGGRPFPLISMLLRVDSRAEVDTR
uniref:RING-type domain-containing protein n=1 Tax=Ananas comosus var. bracteatus TaxID=296719 RepID=A0A6V7QV47_ANACO